MLTFAPNHLRINGRDETPESPDPHSLSEPVRSWLTALVGAEHLSLLIGSGLGIAVSNVTGTTAYGMDRVDFAAPDSGKVNDHAEKVAKAAGRGAANIEDQLRSALQLLAGLQISSPEGEKTRRWEAALNAVLADFARRGLVAEASMRTVVEGNPPNEDADGSDDTDDKVEREEQSDELETDRGAEAARLLVGFLLAFATRPVSRERLNIFTTNYDRLIEYGCDLGGIRVLDRFVGSIEPVFRASRLDVDMHYNPPGIRGEPRYLEGVVRLCKLHGSLDWRFRDGLLRRVPLAFGGEDPEIEQDALRRLMIYPSSAKDVETALFPYAELFRDLSAALCRPNSVLVTFGYGFGDDHINRVIRDMLTLRSTHVLVISFGDPGGRVASFLAGIAKEQYSLLFGSHFGDLATLVDNYLPQPGSDVLMLRSARRRQALSPASLAHDGDRIGPDESS